MILLCAKHHTTVHEGAWHIRMLAPGRFIFINPHGHLVLSPPDHTTHTIIARLIDLTAAPSRDGPGAGRDHGDAA